VGKRVKAKKGPKRIKGGERRRFTQTHYGVGREKSTYRITTPTKEKKKRK